MKLDSNTEHTHCSTNFTHPEIRLNVNLSQYLQYLIDNMFPFFFCPLVSFFSPILTTPTLFFFFFSTIISFYFQILTTTTIWIPCPEKKRKKNSVFERPDVQLQNAALRLKSSDIKLLFGL